MTQGFRNQLCDSMRCFALLWRPAFEPLTTPGCGRRDRKIPDGVDLSGNSFKFPINLMHHWKVSKWITESLIVIANFRPPAWGWEGAGCATQSEGP